jgi:hypothetical protein
MARTPAALSGRRTAVPRRMSDRVRAVGMVPDLRSLPDGRTICYGEPMTDGAHAARRVVLARAGLDALLAALRDDGYVLVGPTVRDGAIVYRKIDGADDLPIGWREEQEAGTYRLRRRDDDAVFGHNLGPNSWKERFFAPRLRQWQAHRDGTGFRVDAEQSLPPGTTRAC